MQTHLEVTLTVVSHLKSENFNTILKLFFLTLYYNNSEPTDSYQIPDYSYLFIPIYIQVIRQL